MRASDLPARRHWRRNLAGTATVAILAAALAWGLPALDRHLPAARPLRDGAPYRVGGGVRLTPPPDSLLDLAAARPARRTGTARFLVGPVRLAIVVRPYGRDLTAAAARLRARITARRGSQVTEPERPYRTDAGAPGLVGGYLSAGRIGWYVVLLHRGVAVEITASGHPTDLYARLEAIDTSARSVTIGPPR